jgi:hypothetical protein
MTKTSPLPSSFVPLHGVLDLRDRPCHLVCEIDDPAPA